MTEIDLLQQIQASLQILTEALSLVGGIGLSLIVAVTWKG